MIELTIDNIQTSVKEGTTVLQAAEKLGISIPTMCYLKGFSNNPSCMVCLVKDLNTGKLQASCALLVSAGMKISTNDNEVINARKEALELLLSDHVGDCEAPCRLTCPAFMNIPLMNRLIIEKKYAEALQVVKEEIALPLILGYICPAPCEKACRRKQLDTAVSICQLKKFVAIQDINTKNPFLPTKKAQTGKKIAIIGTGPAGLSNAYYLLINGHECVLFDKNEIAGGDLLKIPEKELPRTAIKSEIEIIEKLGAKFVQNKKINKKVFENEILDKFDAIILATGNFENSNITDLGFEKGKSGILLDKNTLQVNETGIFACGNIIRTGKMAVTSVAQGKQAAFSVNLFLEQEKPAKIKRKFNSKFGKLLPTEIEEYKKETIEDDRVHLKNKLETFTEEQAILEATRCMHCDCRKPETCKLREYSGEYQADRRRCLVLERKILKKYFQHDTVVYEPEKCIRCNLCVEIATKNSETLGLTAIHRGFNVEINVPFNKSFSKALLKTAEKCAEACPTGALSLKK